MKERILITQLGFIGDVILSTPVIAAVRAAYPEAELYFLTTALSSPFVSHDPELTEVISYDKRGDDRGFSGFFRLRRKLLSLKLDKIFSIHRSSRTSLLHYLSGAKERFGFSEASLSVLYSKTTNRPKGIHDVLRNLSILRAAGIEPAECPLRITLPSDVEEKVKTFLPADRYLVIAPGSVWATKRWTVEGFRALSNLLTARGEHVVLVGGASDSAVAEAISRGGAVTNLVGKLSLVESAAVIKNAQVVVSNDSAPLHFASAFVRPTVALFCATIPEFGFGPYGTRSEVLGVEGLACRPCGRHGKNYCPTGTHACQVGISPAKVLAAIDRLMT